MVRKFTDSEQFPYFAWFVTSESRDSCTAALVDTRLWGTDTVMHRFSASAENTFLTWDESEASDEEVLRLMKWLIDQ